MVRGNLEVKRHRFTAREYHAMGEAGILGEDARVELVDGETHLLVEQAQGRYFVSVQNPVRLSERVLG